VHKGIGKGIIVISLRLEKDSPAHLRPKLLALFDCYSIPDTSSLLSKNVGHLQSLLILQRVHCHRVTHPCSRVFSEIPAKSGFGEFELGVSVVPDTPASQGAGPAVGFTQPDSVSSL
jgi:hypothetical protein